MRLLVAFAVAVISLCASSAYAEFTRGKDLVAVMDGYEKVMRNEATAFDTAMALSFTWYIRGVYDARDREVCLGAVTQAQCNAIVAKYLKEHPEQWDENAAVLVLDALRLAFPCE